MFNDLPIVLVVGSLHFQAELRGLLAARSYRIMLCNSLRDLFENEKPEGPRCLVIDLDIGLTVPSSHTRHSVPTVFVTERCELSACVRAMKMGAVDILERPLRAESLFAAVDEALAVDYANRARRQEMTRLQNHYASLTPRERQVLPLIASGLLNKQTAAELGTAEITIRVHRGQIMRKMAAQSLADLVRMADKLGLQTPSPNTFNSASTAEFVAHYNV